ncbi:uncharacterized protein PV09_07840 [Verruconis gallopava]|uniref:Peroxin 26 n=1 Tax=Verruconis gallopava TaxID=253628 RepID=A0A0D1YIG8_9PEZI|nr:uncharacterized protein PV09_07840 [Verruconis gallopava]KIW00647.1 hypothetical protein PV09_07840 [Verruconis gallopava]
MNLGGGATEVMPTVQEDSWANGSGILSSTGSLQASRHQTSHIAKTYRQAANLYLTRRLPEALSTIEAVITPQHSEHGNGNSHALAPIASASRGTRIKVWSFYLTFLNSVVELGPEEGKHAFGSVRWKQLVNKARDGTVWEDIVRDGYGGNEGAVDADVVINLATLLLTHSPSQKLNQQRLEAYFAAISQPSFDIAAHFSTPARGFTRRPSGASGTNTPRDLQSNVKLLELYTLHVLPRNGEWDYAREFILMSEVLDEERKEAFLQALQGLKDEQENAEKRERELQKQQREQLEEQRRLQEEQRIAEAKRAEEEARRREEARKYPQRPPDAASPTGVASSSTRPVPQSPSGPRSRPSAAIPSKKNQVARQRNDNTAPPQQTLYKRAAAILSNIQAVIFNMGQGLANNPMALMRMLLFLLMFALAFGRRDIRERLKRALGKSWDKIAATVGMGTKVSYI